MDDLRRMVVFFHVVDSGSFSGAAKRLGVARSAISRHISVLETNLGVRLLNRTTRSLKLTEAGETYYLSCSRIVAESERARRQLRGLQESLQGTLRVAAPVSLGSRFIAPLVAEFLEQHRALDIDLVLDDRIVDMVEEGIDVSIRIGWLQDSSLIARKIGDWPRLLCASPDYLERYGRPRHPSDLSSHEWIIFTRLPTPHRWTFTKKKQSWDVQVDGRLKTNSGDAVRSLLVMGAGIAAMSEFLLGEDVRAGRLEPLLQGYDCGSAGMYAVYHDRNFQSAKVKLFIDFIASQLQALIQT